MQQGNNEGNSQGFQHASFHAGQKKQGYKGHNDNQGGLDNGGPDLHRGPVDHLQRTLLVFPGQSIRVTRKGGIDVVHTAVFAESGEAEIDGAAVDARAFSAGHWSLVGEAGHHEAIVERRGKSGVDVVMGGLRIALKWKPADD